MAEQPTITVDLHFHLSKERFENEATLGMQAALEDFTEGIVKVSAIRDLMALFLVDKNGAWLDQRTAKATLNALKGKQIEQAGAEFTKALQDFLSPGTNAASLSSPSTPVEVPSPNGSTT